MQEQAKRKEFLLQQVQDDGVILRTNYPRSIRAPNGKGLAWLVDVRRLLLRPAFLEHLSEYFWELFAPQWPFQIGGVETAATPFVTALLLKGHQKGFDVKGFIVRKERKSSGLCLQVEGELNDFPILLVDDLINSGGSIERAQLALNAEGQQISDVFVLINFMREDTKEFLDAQEITVAQVFTSEDLSLPTVGSVINSWEQPNLDCAWVFKPENPNYTFNVPNSNPLCHNGAVFFGGSDNHFYALDQQNGDLIWKLRVGKTPKSIMSSPIVYNEHIFFGAYDGNVYALSCKNGERLWINREADFVGSSPALAPDLGLLFIGTEYNSHENHGALVALGLDSGENIWWYPLPNYLHGSPIYLPDRKQVAVGTNDGFVILLNAENGELIWEFDANGEVKHSLAYDPEREILCFGSFNGKIYGVDVNDGSERFHVQTENAVYATPLIVGNKLFCPSTDFHMYVYDLDQEKILRKLSSFGKLHSSPTLIGNDVFWGGNDGIFRGVNVDSLKKTHWIRVSERLLSKAAFSEDRFFINGAGSTLYAFQSSISKKI